ncbi:MAG: hypothetical protein NTV68_00425 [Methanomicrobiales archaeon]|nr:hypothetical protein [Methanomicrobiales archaeon]
MLFTVWRLDVRGRPKVGGRDEGDGVQGIAGEIGLGPAIQLAMVSRASDYLPNQLLRSYSLAVGLSFMVWLPPCCSRLAAGCTGEAKVGGRDEGVRVQGIAGRN